MLLYRRASARCSGVCFRRNAGAIAIWTCQSAAVGLYDGDPNLSLEEENRSQVSVLDAVGTSGTLCLPARLAGIIVIVADISARRSGFFPQVGLAAGIISYGFRDARAPFGEFVRQPYLSRNRSLAWSIPQRWQVSPTYSECNIGRRFGPE